MTAPKVPRFKTSVTVMGERQIDEFQALCVAEFVALMVKGRREHRAWEQARVGVVNLGDYRRARG